MQLIPTEQEVIELLKQTGALRYGHFEYPNGMHSDMYLQPALAMRHYETAKLLSVALSRKLRANSEIRAIIPELSVVAPATGGLPVAYGMCEALRAHQVYWAENSDQGGPLRFRPHLEPQRGEKVLLVDDVLRSGKKLAELKRHDRSPWRRGGRIGCVDLPAQPGYEEIWLPALLLSDRVGRHVLRRCGCGRIVEPH